MLNARVRLTVQVAQAQILKHLHALQVKCIELIQLILHAQQCIVGHERPRHSITLTDLVSDGASGHAPP